MPTQFTKMHGLGNDFIIIDGINQTVQLNDIKQLCDRHLGIGCDQLLLIEKSSGADFACRIFNADGTEAEQCGNGMRCVARFIHEKQLCQKNSFSIATKSVVSTIIIHHYNTIEVTMGRPAFEPSLIPFKIDKQQAAYTIDGLSFIVLSMGNPHAITFVSELATYPVTAIGEKISTHALFPNGTNVGFVEIINRQTIRLRTYERGARETLACGSNACAAVVAGIISNQLDRNVVVQLTHGNLIIAWPDETSPVVMTGPATNVFHGEF